jgi:hypothetical protein
MRALKLLVVIMGVLLVGGTVVLIIAVVDRASHRPATPAPVATRGFDRAVIDLPEGARVLGSEVVGDRLVVRVGLAEGGETLIVIDPRSGARLGTIELRPAAPGGSK